MRHHGDIRIGVSGWTYPPWRGAFYPAGLPQKRELAYAAASFNALEINGTFYGMQVPQSFAAWGAAAPTDFVYAVKGPRYITHLLRLKNVEAPLANFFASGVLNLGPRLGPILWQFPARFGFEPERLADFFRLLPRTRSEAAALGQKHDGRLRAPPALEIGEDAPIRHAIEIRHESFRDADFIALLREQGIALVCADTVDWPRLMDLTADFAYCRLHGATELYRSRYSDEELARWAKRFSAWSTGKKMTDGDFAAPPQFDGMPRDVFVFFDNTDKLQAPDNAHTLMRMLAVAPAGDPASIAPH